MKSLLKSTFVWAAALAMTCSISNLLIAQDEAGQPGGRKTVPETQSSAPAIPACGCCKSGGASQTSPIIMALDIDKDGRISAAEIRNASLSLQALDADGDGNLNRHEMHARSEFPEVNAPSQSNLILGVTRDYYAQTLLLRDANKNGQLEMEEMNGPTLEILETIDTNGDLILSYEELRDINKPQPSPLTQPEGRKPRNNAPIKRTSR